MGADKQECHMPYAAMCSKCMGIGNNTAIHHRLRVIVSLVKMNCNVQCNAQLITDGH